MALIKTITNPQNGHADTYWRITVIHSDAPAQVVTIMLGGYRDASWRQAGGQPNQSREIVARGADFVALASSSPDGQTVFDVMATAAYDYVRTKRRPIPPGVDLDQDGGVTLPTGEHFTADQITNGTVPSEFHDALNG